MKAMNPILPRSAELLLLIALPFMALVSLPLHAQDAATDAGNETGEEGRFIGAIQTEHPDWFKESFLEFEDDIDEAAAEGKRLMVYFHQDGCPYCNKLVEENFRDPDIHAAMQDGFDVVALNMWGDREVIQVGGRQFTEKTLAAALNVNFTPTLLVFDEQRDVAFRLDGYLPPAEFRHALDYAGGDTGGAASFAEYMARFKAQSAASALDQVKWPMPDNGDLSGLVGDRPLAVIFEEPACEACQLLLDRTFTNEEAGPLLEQFNLVQVHRWQDREIVTPDGRSTTVEAWARELDIGFSPSVVLFDPAGQPVMTAGTLFRTFHMLSMFDYVASGAYHEQPSFQRYLTERSEHIRAAGKDVNIWTY